MAFVIFGMNEELVELDKMMPQDEGTMEVLKDMANTAYDCVRFTVDCPTLNLRNVLDLNVYVIEIGGSKSSMIYSSLIDREKEIKLSR